MSKRKTPLKLFECIFIDYLLNMYLFESSFRITVSLCYSHSLRYRQ